VIPSRYKFDIEESEKAILTKGGYVQLGTKINLPVLEGLGILGFGLNPKGIVEPHWHTNAGELVYIVKGKTRITVLSPDGHVDDLEVNAGQGAFAPASHFHNIENVGSDDVEVIAFFSNSDPDYIGIGEVIGSYSNDLLASVFNTKPDYFDTFKKPTGPLVIVPV
jgi:oxalate decarboxylase